MKVRERFDAIAGAGVQVLTITFASADRLEGFRAGLELPFPVATDPEREAYRRFGLLRGSRWAVWHPRVLWKYVVLVSRGAKLRRSNPGEDLSQLGGDFVIGADGRILLAHRSHRPDDRPDVAVLMSALAGAQRPATGQPVARL